MAFQFFKNPESIKRKINSFAHQEFNIPKFNNIKEIEKKIAKGEDLFERNINYKVVDLDNSFPNYIIVNKNKFKNWIA